MANVPVLAHPLFLSSLLFACVHSLLSNLSLRHAILNLLPTHYSAHFIPFAQTTTLLYAPSSMDRASHCSPFHPFSFTTRHNLSLCLSHSTGECVCERVCLRVGHCSNERWHDHDARRHGCAGDALPHRHAQEQHVPGLRAVRRVPRRKGAWWNEEETTRKPGRKEPPPRNGTKSITPVRWRSACVLTSMALTDGNVERRSAEPWTPCGRNTTVESSTKTSKEA